MITGFAPEESRHWLSDAYVNAVNTLGPEYRSEYTGLHFNLEGIRRKITKGAESLLAAHEQGVSVWDSDLLDIPRKSCSLLDRLMTERAQAPPQVEFGNQIEAAFQRANL
ncbi:MAG: hypothetical protein OXR66_09270 [Candidatus Woesearchaeota archaeon]|nr:hypothetical protein [Candidatus Woesearchaeota archaeon]